LSNLAYLYTHFYLYFITQSRVKSMPLYTHYNLFLSAEILYCVYSIYHSNLLLDIATDKNQNCGGHCWKWSDM